MLRVGPRSAGAVPGPACYGRGGDQATVTDALVVLGYIDPTRFLGGDFELDADAARDACARLGAKIDLDPDDVAWGIRQLALAGMVKATRARTSALGLDPRRHSLLSFGGSGSLFTPDIATSIGSKSVLVPDLASVLSAFGSATTDVRRERLQSVSIPAPIEDVQLIEKIVDELAAAVRSDLVADGIEHSQQELSFEADLRFSKQVFELQVPFRANGFDDAANDQLLHEFSAEYARRYGQGSITLGAPIEVVAIRAIGIGHTARASFERQGTDQPEPREAAASGSRKVRVERSGERTDVPSYDGATLKPGDTIIGPALVDGADTTVWMPLGAQGRIDPYGTLQMEVH
jgi:N-methylhydantoinase A